MSLPQPFSIFGEWLAEAQTREPNNPSAMSVATVGPGGRPSLRMVLLRGFDARGFVFYTNMESRKGHELRENAQVALCFHWKSMDRQVRIEGRAALVDAAEADAYYHSRPRDSQISAWASRQSEVLPSREVLEARVEKYSALYAVGKVPRPPFWSGYRVVPDLIELWEERPFRLHDRHEWRREGENWTETLRYP
jgi:pyridoxamine 5'-phosphate oxidase